ncbi:putative cytochrome P450 [Lyophyllum shimeji]|uniref:Cytochrome P450 n=1 Tax=Lyophyllum shimeji TaxID=47721 RepID=A0A9P3PTC0_LYOSH|nr:putative cytochrome P450 [Lyophyllum shimeji]
MAASGNLTPPSVMAMPSADSTATFTVLAGATIGVVFTAIALQHFALGSTEDIDLGGFSILTAWTFFKKRYDFMLSNFKARKMFRFRVLQHRVVALSGEAARQVFFNELSLDLPEGYRILKGGAPQMRDIHVEEPDMKDLSAFNKQLISLLRKERIDEILPVLFEDVHQGMKTWGKQGTLNPFKEIYELVFQMNVRLATCRELAEDKKAVAKLGRHYWELEKAASPVALLLPWFPSRAKKDQEAATMNLFQLIAGYVELRRKAPHPNSDAIDVLIANGDSTEAIVGFVLGVVFSGFVNTGMNVCWNLLYLGMNAEWKKKVAAEVQALMANHTDTLSTEPLHKRLSSIPMQAWEDEMPALDAVIRETLRLIAGSGIFLRRNLLKDFDVEGVKIKKGDFLAYVAADVHLNPEIYPDPFGFDPGRYDEGRAEDKKVSHAFLGWGAGRHPCNGMRVAKLEMKLVIALVIAGYDFEIIDSSGKFPSALPQPDRNDYQQARPIGEPCFIKFRRIVD